MVAPEGEPEAMVGDAIYLREGLLLVRDGEVLALGAGTPGTLIGFFPSYLGGTYANILFPSIPGQKELTTTCSTRDFYHVWTTVRRRTRLDRVLDA